MSVYEASVTHAFKATHAIRMPDGSFEEPHEHPWRVTASFRSDKLDGTMGVVIDFVRVREALEAVTGPLAGRDLRELPALAEQGAPAELVARLVAEQLIERLGPGAGLYRVAVTEAPACEAAYYPDLDLPGDRL